METTKVVILVIQVLFFNGAELEEWRILPQGTTLEACQADVSAAQEAILEKVWYEQWAGSELLLLRAICQEH